MEAFSALLPLCAGNSSITGEFPAQRSVTRSSNVFFDLRLNKRLSNQSWDWWFETPSRPLWHHCNAITSRIHFRWQLATQSTHCPLWIIIITGSFVYSPRGGQNGHFRDDNFDILFWNPPWVWLYLAAWHSPVYLRHAKCDVPYIRHIGPQ